jgi:hypothetical protein
MRENRDSVKKVWLRIHYNDQDLGEFSASHSQMCIGTIHIFVVWLVLVGYIF